MVHGRRLNDALRVSSHHSQGRADWEEETGTRYGDGDGDGIRSRGPGNVG